MPWFALAGTAISAIGAVESQKSKAAASIAQQPAVKNDPVFQTSEQVFDNSGWNIAFAGSRIDSTAEKTTSQQGADAPGSGVGQQGGLIPAIQSAFGNIDQKTLIYAGVGVLALAIWKRRKS